MSIFRILGPVQAIADGRALPVGGPQQLKLLALLVLHANRATSSDALIDVIWGPQRGGSTNRLQMAVARLRKALAPLNDGRGSPLRTIGGGYMLSITPGELDAELFSRRVRDGRRALDDGDPARAVELLNEALGLWRGPPLAELSFEDFAQAEIRQLEELRLLGLEGRIEAELRLGRHTYVIGELEGLLAEQPTRERIAGQLMLALYRSGRQADALEVYQRIRYQLAEQLGLEPGPALRDLQTEILDQGPALVQGRKKVLLSPGAHVGAPLPSRVRPYGPSTFINRRIEREALAQALSDAASFGRRAAFVTGEPGIGKTRLVSEIAQEAHLAGTLVLAGRCDEELTLPYQPFVEALEQLVEHAPQQLLENHVADYGDSVARLLPALAARVVDEAAIDPEPSESQRYVLFRAIEGLLAAAGAGSVVLVVLEDLHWAERPTLKLLRSLLTSPRDSRLMLLCTCRVTELDEGHPLRELLADLHREPGVLRLDLHGLDTEDVVALVRGIVDDPMVIADDRLARTLQVNTNGNPFFITELVRNLAETETPVNQDERWQRVGGDESGAQLPVSVSETLARRLRRLGDDVRQCLCVAAVVGNEFELELVSAVADGFPAAESLDRAVDAGVLIPMPGRSARFRFSHALMQRFVYRELGSARRSDLHRRVALALERGREGDGSLVADLARHWVAARDADPGKALRYAALAGDEAFRKLAPDEARRWYEIALGLLDRQPDPREDDRCDLLVRRGEAQRQAGDRGFRETLLEAAGIAQQSGAEDWLVRAALANTRGMQSETGVIDEARIATLNAALRVVGAGDSSERARLLAQQAAELMYSEQWDRRVRLSDEALAIGRRLDDPDALSTVLNMRFVSLLAPETQLERRTNTLEAVAVADRTSDPLARFFAYHWRAYACLEAGDLVAARSWAAREREIAERYRQPTTLWLASADEANLAIVAGELEQADRLAAATFEIGWRSEPDALACYAAQRASIAFETGSLGELIPMLEETVDKNPGVPGFRAILALALSESSRLPAARELFDEAAASSFGDLPHDVTRLTVACIYAHVAARLGDHPAAPVLYEMLEPWREQIAFPAFGVWGPVSLYSGVLALAIGEVDAAELELWEAVRAAARAGAPIWEARARAQLARLAEVVP